MNNQATSFQPRHQLKAGARKGKSTLKHSTSCSRNESCCGFAEGFKSGHAEVMP